MDFLFPLVVNNSTRVWCENSVNTLLSNMELILVEQECYKILVIPNQVVSVGYMLCVMCYRET